MLYPHPFVTPIPSCTSPVHRRLQSASPNWPGLRGALQATAAAAAAKSACMNDEGHGSSRGRSSSYHSTSSSSHAPPTAAHISEEARALRTLGADTTASVGKLKRMHRLLALKHHPDKVEFCVLLSWALQRHTLCLHHCHHHCVQTRSLLMVVQSSATHACAASKHTQMTMLHPTSGMAIARPSTHAFHLGNQLYNHLPCTNTQSQMPWQLLAGGRPCQVQGDQCGV